MKYRGNDIHPDKRTGQLKNNSVANIVRWHKVIIYSDIIQSIILRSMVYSANYNLTDTKHNCRELADICRIKLNTASRNENNRSTIVSGMLWYDAQLSTWRQN